MDQPNEKSGLGTVTRLLHRAAAGDISAPESLSQAYALMYEIIALLASRLRIPQHRWVDFSDAINDVYLSLQGRINDPQRSPIPTFATRHDFARYVVGAVLQILWDKLHREDPLSLDAVPEPAAIDSSHIFSGVVRFVEPAMSRLKQENEDAWRAVNHRYLQGLTIRKTAQLLQISSAKVRRDSFHGFSLLAKYLTELADSEE